MNDLGYGADVLVNKFVDENGWNLPTSTSGDLMSIWDIIRRDITPHPQYHDEVVWVRE